MSKTTTVESFSRATDALIGGLSLKVEGGPELALARRLRESAHGPLPDPAFVSALRGELVKRAPRANHDQSTRFSTLATPLGILALAYRKGRLLFCARVESEGEAARAVAGALDQPATAEASPPARIADGVLAHIEGRRRFRGIDLSALPAFQRRVLEKTAQIPRGQVRPYSWVAREIGAPGAVRAVGTALGHNPLPFIVPCHRVVRADGSLGEYSGGGPAMKARVLEFEGVRLAPLRDRMARGERYTGCRSTRIVCFPTCGPGRRMRPENAVPFHSLAEAAASGYRPCKVCRPA